MTKRIVIDARGYHTSTGRYTRKLIEYLERIDGKNHNREYIVLLHKKEFKDYTPKAGNFSKQVADFSHYGLAEQFGFLKFLEGLKADLVHFTMPQQPVFYRGNHVTTLHDLTLIRVFPGNKNWLVFRFKQLAGVAIFKRIAKTSSHIIAPSEYTKKDYAEFANIDPQKITVTLESADRVSKNLVEYSDLKNKQFIMYVGQQSNYKNLRRLIKAHQILLKTNPELLLVFVGKMNPYGDQTKDWVQKNGFKNVVYTGFASDDQLAWMYAHCAAYVFPSLMEGFGLPGLEAMASGAPVVSSNATSLPEVHGNAAIYFNPEDVTEMAEKINDVLKDSTLRATLVKNGRKRVKEFSWERMAQQTLAVYKNALKKRN
jgi:glycosyltransferase involved in cell wall biosynthesis